MSKCWNQRETVDINGALFTEIILTVLTEEGKTLMWMTTACFSLIVSFLLNCKASVGSLLFNRHWRNYTLRTILVKLCASRQCLAENSRENQKQNDCITKVLRPQETLKTATTLYSRNIPMLPRAGDSTCFSEVTVELSSLWNTRSETSTVLLKAMLNTASVGHVVLLYTQ